MRRIFALMLALIMCFSLCACGGRYVASPGSANEEATGETANNADDNVSGDAAENDTDASNDNSNDNDTNDNVVTESGEFISSSGSIAAPESTEKYNYASSGADIEISYGEGMNVTEGEEGYAVVEHGASKLYVENVTDDFDPSSMDPATYLYEYAYEKCAQLVVENYGDIEQFQGEYTLEVSGNEIYGYGAHIITARQMPVYAFIKLVTLDGGEGYAVTIGICEESTMEIFDNVEVE